MRPVRPDGTLDSIAPAAGVGGYASDCELSPHPRAVSVEQGERSQGHALTVGAVGAVGAGNSRRSGTPIRPVQSGGAISARRTRWTL